MHAFYYWLNIYILNTIFSEVTIFLHIVTEGVPNSTDNFIVRLILYLVYDLNG